MKFSDLFVIVFFYFFFVRWSTGTPEYFQTIKILVINDDLCGYLIEPQ